MMNEAGYSYPKDIGGNPVYGVDRINIASFKTHTSADKKN